MNLNIPKINGPDKVFFGKNKETKEDIYITKPSFDCDWYWSFGYLGNNNCHYHLNDYSDKDIYIKYSDSTSTRSTRVTRKRNKCMSDCLEEDYILSKIIKDNIWLFCELSLTIYSLKEMAEIVHRGGSHMTSNPGKEYLKDDNMYKKLVEELIPKQCQTLWDLIK